MMVEKIFTNDEMIVHPLGIVVEIIMVALLIVGGITAISIILR
jgi:hypothetical protein